MEMDWNAIVKATLSATVVSGFIVWLVKVLIDRFFDRRATLYTKELEIKQQVFSHQIDKSLEEYKNELQLSFQKSVQLMQNQFNKITELHELLIDLEEALNKLTEIIEEPLNEPKSDPRSSLIEIHMMFEQILLFYRKNRILFSPALVSEIQNVINACRKAFVEYREYDLMKDLSTGGEAIHKLFDSYASVREDIPKALLLLEEKARLLIGVDTTEIEQLN